MNKNNVNDKKLSKNVISKSIFLKKVLRDKKLKKSKKERKKLLSEFEHENNKVELLSIKEIKPSIKEKIAKKIKSKKFAQGIIKNHFDKKKIKNEELDNIKKLESFVKSSSSFKKLEKLIESKKIGEVKKRLEKLSKYSSNLKKLEKQLSLDKISLKKIDFLIHKKQ